MVLLETETAAADTQGRWAASKAISLKNRHMRLCHRFESLTAKETINLQITTSRLLLREFIANDLDPILQYESDPLVVQYVCYGPLSRAECEKELAFHIAHQRTHPRTFYHLALAVCETQMMIGWCGIKIVHPKEREGELGYALNRAYWGCGYMSEAAAALVGFGFQELQLQRIIATCHPENRASIRVLERIGMQYEGRLHENRWCKSNWRSTNIYALLEHEWHS